MDQHTLPVLMLPSSCVGFLISTRATLFVSEVLEQVVSDLVAASRESPDRLFRSRTHTYHWGPEDLLQRKGVVIEEGLPVGFALPCSSACVRLDEAIKADELDVSLELLKLLG